MAREVFASAIIATLLNDRVNLNEQHDLLRIRRLSSPPLSVGTAPGEGKGVGTDGRAREQDNGKPSRPAPRFLTRPTEPGAISNRNRRGARGAGSGSMADCGVLGQKRENARPVWSQSWRACAAACMRASRSLVVLASRCRRSSSSASRAAWFVRSRTSILCSALMVFLFRTMSVSGMVASFFRKG